MRNGSHCALSNRDADNDKPAEPLVSRYVEGQSSSPAIAYNYYCLNKSPVEDKCSEYSYDSVDGTNLRDELLNVIGFCKAAPSAVQDDEVIVQTTENVCKDSLEILNTPQQPSNWTKKNVNRWLHFQSISETAPKPNPAIQTLCDQPIAPTVCPKSSTKHSPSNSEMSFDPDQHWDGYQEIYSTDGSSIVDLSAAEELLHFGDNYSDLLRKSVDNDCSTAPSERSSSLSSMSSSPVFHDQSNAHAQLDDSFLLSGYTKSLELSALKSIDEIFDFTALHSNVGSYGAIEWIDPSRSPRRSPSGTSCSQSTLSTSSRQRDESTLATSNYFSALDTGQGDEGFRMDSSNQDTSRSISMESLLDDIHDKTLVPTKSSPIINKTAETKPLPIVVRRDESTTQLLTKRTVHKARRRKPIANSSPSTANSNSDSSDETNVIENIKHIQPHDVQNLVDTCRSHLGCLNHVLLGQTVNCIVQHPAMNIHKCEAANQSDQLCRCGPIARFVQSMIDFLLDFSNSFRHFRLYQLFVRTIRQLYGMVQTVSAGVRRHRMEMNSIEFVL